MLEKLSSSMGTNQQQYNIDLAAELAESENKATIAELAENLFNKEKAVANDCIKVLYEVGKIKPELIQEHIDVFLQLILSKNNRMVWGSMYAVAQVSPYKIDKVNEKFDNIITAYKNGSVITIDCCMIVFGQIAKANVSNSKKAYDLIINHLKTCRPKEIPQHSEKIFICINDQNYIKYENVLKDRFDAMTASQQKRVKKILDKIEKKNFSS